MNSPFRPKTINVPGVLSDNAFQEQLKQYTDQQNAIQDSAPAPDSAVDFASKIQDEYLKAPTPSVSRSVLPAALPGPLGALAGGLSTATHAGDETQQDRLIRLRSDLLSQAVTSIPDSLKDSTALAGTPFGAALPIPGILSQLGTLTDPADRKAAAEQQLADAKMQQTADETGRAQTAQTYNDMSDEDLMASVPGASSPEQARAMLALSAEKGVETQKMFAGKTAEKQKNVETPAKQPTQTWWLNAIQNGVKGVASIPIGASRGFAEAAELARDVSGVDLITGGGRSNMRAWIDTVDQTMNKILPGDKARSKDFVTQLSQGTGSMLGFLMGGYAAAAAGIPATTATTILGAATGGDQSFQDAENFNATTLQKYMALIIGAGIGTTEAIPIDRMFMRADTATGGLIRRTLQNTMAGSLEEFIQETGQQMGQDVLAKFLYDPNRKMDVGSWLTAGAIGALSGGLAGAATTGLHEAGVTHNVQPPEITDLKQREQFVHQAITMVQGAIDKIVTPPAEALPNVAPSVTTVQGEGGTIPVNRNGKFEATHHAAQPLAVIDPSMRGTGPLRGGERARLFGPDAVDRSYFGVGNPNFNQDFKISKETPFKTATDPYHGEGLGPFQHTIEIDPNKVYNWFEDPLNLRGQLDRTSPASEQVTRYEKLIKDAGFEGIYFSESPLGQTALMFNKTTPTRVLDATTGLFQLPAEIPDVTKVQVSPRELDPLPGLTTGSPVKSVVQAARAYAEARGLPVRRQSTYVKADPERGRRIAEAYAQMKDQPNNPKVKRAYKAMIDETLAQYQFVKATGLKIEAIEPGMKDPYPEGPKQVLEDLQRGHLWFFPTESGFGTQNEADKRNPLLAPTNEKIGDRTLLANDVFRIVHDFFGHGIEGSGFGARGEENAWQSHMRLYSQAALPAVTSETRGQNSWVNFGPHGETNRANQKETVYADQKTGIMPAWTWQEGVADEVNATDLLAQIAKPEKIKELTGQVPGLKGVMKHMTADEKAKLKKQNAAKIVDIFTNLPDPKEMAAVAFSGRAKRGWYRRSAQALIDIFGLNDAPRFAALLAALSPQTSVESNAVNALNMWTNWVNAGRPTSEAAIRRLLGQSVQGGKGEASVLPAWINNTMTALLEPDALNIRLSGPKVDSFMRNLQGEVNAVTNDAWMANFANVDQALFAKTGPAPGKGAGYIGMSAAVRAAAETATRLTGERWTPAEIQETVWSWAKTLYEKASAAGENRTAEQILKAGDLTAEEIGNTPDFASLFVGGVYRKILEAGGYNLDAIAAGSSQSDGGAGQRGNPLSAEGSGLAQRTFEKHLKDAARRLDELRARRAEVDAAQSVTLDETFFPDNGAARQNELDNLSEADRQFLDEEMLANRAPVRTGPLPMFPERTDQSFDRWFGDSVVVNPDGTPKVVFHGTPTKDGFRIFDPNKTGKTSVLFSVIDTHRNGFFFAENEEFAKTFADQGRAPGKIMPVFLSIQHPLDVTESTNITVNALKEIGRRAQEIDPSITNPGFFADRAGRDDFWEVLDTPEGGDAFVQAAKDMGYDGIRMYEPNHDTRDSELVWVAFDNTQIKSAEENTGAYSPTNPDIHAQRMGTSNSRQPVKGEPTRPAQGVASQQGASTSDVSLAQLSKNLIGLMDLTARQGRITIKGPGVLGQYSRKQDVVRVKTWNDFSTLAHEAGHALYFDASASLKTFVASNDQQLMDVATKTYGGDVNKLPKGEHIAEGFAELFRLYTTNKAYAQREFPALTRDFEAVLDQHAPELKQGLDLIGQQFAAWLQLPSVQLVRNMIVPGVKETGINAAVKELRDIGFGTWMQEYTRKTVDGLANRYTSVNAIVRDILNIGQESKGKAIDLKRSEDPRVLIRLAQNAGARAMVQASDGIMGYHGLTPETRSLRDALLLSQGLKVDDNLSRIDPVKKQDFAAYLVALRGIDEYRRFAEGKIERPPLAATLGDLQQTVQELNAQYPQFAEAAQVVNDYGMGLWKKSYDAGLMDKETYEDGLDRQFYAPLQRDMSDKKSSLGASALTNGASIVKRFRGSDRNIVDPMDVLLHKTFATEQIIAKNDVAKALASLADRAGRAGALVERVPASQLIGRQYSVKEIARQLTKDDTISASDAQDLMEILQSSIEDDNVLSLFRAEQASTKGENILFFWEGGKLTALQVQDGDVGADLVNVMNGLGRENMPMFVNLIAQTSSIFRASITSWPDFLITNFIRDQMSAFILTDVGYKPFVTGLRGVFDELRQRQWAQQYNASMGIMGGMNVAALHEARVNRDLNSLRKKGYVARAFTSDGHSYLGAAANGMAKVVELTETGTRLGIYRAAFNRAKADGLGDWDAAIEAGYTATDYIDFGLNGSRMLVFRKTIPFLNAQIQALNKMMRTLGGDDVRQRLGLRFAVGSYFKSINNLDLSRTERMALRTGRRAWIKMAALGLISAALHFLFEDDPDYQEAGEYLRTTGWVIPLGNGRIFYIPKPFELAMVANFVERGIEHASGDPQAKFRFMRGLAMTMTPPTAPPSIQTAIELAANKDFFTGREIVPSYMQALQPQLQYDNYTTELAKQIGQITGFSPMVVDHVMSSLGASAYRDLTTMYNATDPNRPALDATDVPILRRFVRDVRRGSVSAQDFWGIASTVNGSLRSAEVTYKTYLEGGNTRAADEFLMTLSPDERAYALLATNFKADAKRLNPFYRARQITTIVSAMRRELVSELGLEDTTTKLGDTIKLSATEKQQLDDALSEYARREMRNTLIAEQAPGWGGKKVLDLGPTHDLINAIDPRVSEELDRRINKAKVYNFDVVNEYWPEVRDRLNRDRENTFLKDILTIAKVAR